MSAGSIDRARVPKIIFPPEGTVNYDILVTEDETPVDSVYAAWQHLLLTVPLLESWPGPGEGCPRWVTTDVGLFYSPDEPAYSPDVMICLGVPLPRGDSSRKENRSYFIWKYKKSPEALVEVVSNTVGGELTTKLDGYARIGVDYYVVWDPTQYLGEQTLHCFLRKRKKYVPCEPWFPKLELGVKTWDGVYAGMKDVYLRWCDRQGKFIPTGAEQAEQIRCRGDRQKRRARQQKQRAEQEKQRAEQEKQRQ